MPDTLVDLVSFIRTGDFAATAITAHPGVTTMWLGAAGIVLRRALPFMHLIDAAGVPTSPGAHS